MKNLKSTLLLLSLTVVFLLGGVPSFANDIAGCDLSIDITGPIAPPSCSSALPITLVYTVKVCGSLGLFTPTVTGGTLNAVSTCVSDGDNCCTATLSVTWTSANGSIAVRNSCTEVSFFGIKEYKAFDDINYTHNSTCTISGPQGQLCTNFTQGLYFADTKGPAPSSRQWSVVGNGIPMPPPVTISSPNAAMTTISGFLPNKMYSITHRMFCNLIEEGYCAATVLTVANCGGLKDPDGDRGGEDTDMDIVNLADDDRVMIIGDRGGFDDETRPIQLLDESRSKQAKLYPNPVSAGSRLYLLVSSSKAVSGVKVFDSRGKLLESLNAGSSLLEIETANYPSGIYYVQYMIEGKSETQRFSIAN